MPNIKSAAKRILITKKQTLRNRVRKTKIKNTQKSFLEQVQQNDQGSAKETLDKVFSALDKAAKHNTIHKNKVNRQKSRLQKKLDTIAN